MEAFPQHWMGKPPADQLHWRAEPDERSRITALLAKEADIISGVTVEGRRALESSPKVSVTSMDSCMCVIFMCNLQSGVCADRRVRQAFNFSLDKSEIISRAKDGAAHPLNGPLTPLHFGYDSSTAAYQYDPERAKVLLADSGYPNGIRIVLDVPSTLPNEAPQLAHVVAEYYARVRIETEIKQFADREAYAEMVRLKRIHDACCFDSSPLSTYRVLCEKFHSGVRGPWWQGYANGTVDALIDQAQATVDDLERKEIYRRAYRMIRDDAPWIFLYNPIVYWGVGPKARGWKAGVDCLVRLH
jgi:peptide/nickel transport system substrate-binding protein